MAGLDTFFPVIEFIATPYCYAGVIPLIPGAGMIVWAAGYFSKVGTAIKPFEESTRLVTVGLFRYTRNPIYLGGVFILSGVAILLGSLTPFAVIPAFIWLIQSIFIRVEEGMLETAFGEEYSEYRNKVRRWL